MKVLHAAETIRGGVATVLSDIAHHHAKELGRSHMRFLVPAEQRDYLKSQSPVTTYRRTGRNLSSLLAFAKAFRQEVNLSRPDVIILHSTFAGLIGRLQLLFLRHRAQVIYCPHGWAFTRQGRPSLNLAYASIERCMARFTPTHAIINISRDEHRAALSYGLPDELMQVIHNGSEERRNMRPLTSKANRKGPLQLLFVGRFDRQKGLDRVLPVIAGLGKRVQLTVIGDAVLQDGPSLAFPINSRQLGWVLHDKLFEHYRAADALLVPSRWEGFGLIATEAMQAGTAVIASDVGGLRDIIQNGKTGYLFKTIDQLRTILTTVDRSSLSRMGLNGRTRYLKHFTSRRMAKELLGVIKRLQQASPK